MAGARNFESADKRKGFQGMGFTSESTIRRGARWKIVTSKLGVREKKRLSGHKIVVWGLFARFREEESERSAGKSGSISLKKKNLVL